MKFLRYTYFANFLLILLCLLSCFESINAQKMDRIERERVKSMLKNIKNAIKKDYYDPTFHGIDIEARFKKAEEKLDQTETVGQAFAVIAQVLIEFNDSHLYFRPPATTLRVEYGWRLKMIGDKCFITTVKPKSDAEVKGLKAGSQVLLLEGFRPSRKELWKMLYYYYVVSKRNKIRMTVQIPGEEQPRELEIESKMRQLPNLITSKNVFSVYGGSDSDNEKHLFQKVGGISIWRMPSFGFDPDQVDLIMSDGIRNSSSLILDLRGNGGGYVKTLERLAGYFFDKDLKIADLKGRKEMEPMQAKTQGGKIFNGKLIVLIDSQSGSASEIFARLIQIEKRGTVLGDVSSGSVMQSIRFDGETGSGYTIVLYGASITNADVIMSDGKSVEHIGVVPDETILLTADDLFNSQDKVLAKAIEMLGGNTTPEEAGKFFPHDWSDR